MYKYELLKMLLIPKKCSHKLKSCHVLSHSSHVSPVTRGGGGGLRSNASDHVFPTWSATPQEYAEVVMLYLTLSVANLYLYPLRWVSLTTVSPKQQIWRPVGRNVMGWTVYISLFTPVPQRPGWSSSNPDNIGLDSFILANCFWPSVV